MASVQLGHGTSQMPRGCTLGQPVGVTVTVDPVSHQRKANAVTRASHTVFGDILVLTCILS